ncbi:MAG: GspE/PulE family protein [bacterium]|nr:GspE/PulE family protein [bacterium]
MSVLSEDNQQKVQASLVLQNIISQSDLDQIRKTAQIKSNPFFAELVGSGRINNEVLTKAIADVTNIPYVNLANATIDPNVLALLPRETAERYMSVPLGEMQHRLVVAMLDSSNVQAVDFLSNKIGRPLKVYAASEEGIRRVLKQYRAKLSSDVTEVFAEKEREERASGEREDNAGDNRSIKSVVQDSPISKALNSILEYAASNRASDIHIEPMIEELKIRARIDGVLREIMRLPKSVEAPLVSRIKILSNLKIDEHRVPQDGQFTITVAKRDIDLRIAISPTAWGEQVVIRLLDKSGTSLELEGMGYKGRSLRRIKKALKNSNGMVLTSGPTGSGKSTSMYAMIQAIKNDEINIVTLEDPIEYKIEGVNQIQVNTAVGLTFATGLRSILRQDPDVVMVGEIRDKETAQLAVQAALTGHLVFSTLHTNSAAGILPRLLDMEIEPFLIASTVRTVIGQRLVRRNAEGAKKYQTDAVETEAIQKTLSRILPKDKALQAKLLTDLGYKTLPLAGESAYTLYKGEDSPETPGGYKGRMGLFEVFDVTTEIQDLILKHSTSAEIQKMAMAQGMITMREDGYLKALNGLTTLNEINRVVAEGST